jgi:membrane-associated phospholipid phosphatase
LRDAQTSRRLEAEILISHSIKPADSPYAPSPKAHKSILARLFPPWTWAVNGPLLAVAIIAAVAFGILTAVVLVHPYLSLDATVDRDIQATNWGPLALTFPFFTWLGGPGGLYMQATVLALVLLLNRRAWILALAAFAGGLWYEVFVHVVNRPRPVPSQILRVTEHPGSTSFPSGHLIFITISVAVLMLCLGHRYLPRWARPIGWAAVLAIVLTTGVDRINGGAHWPSDVLAGVLIATAWLTLVVSVRWISDRALAGKEKDAGPRRVSAGA